MGIYEQDLSSGLGAIEKGREETSEKKQNIENQYNILPVPINLFIKAPQLAIPKTAGYSLWQHPIEPFVFDPNLKKWENTAWEIYIPNRTDLQRLFPKGTLRSFTLENGERYTVRIKFDQAENEWQFDWYYNNKEQPYIQTINMKDLPDDYIFKEGGFWDTWGTWILNGASIALLLIFPGAVGFYLSIIPDLFSAGIQFENGETIGAVISLFLAFSPLLGKGIFKISKKEAEFIANKFVMCRTQKEVAAQYNLLSPQQKQLFKDIFNHEPQKLEQALKDQIVERTLQAKKRYKNPTDIFNTINKAVQNGKVSPEKVGKFYTTLGFAQMGFEIGANGVMQYVGGDASKKEIEYQNDKKLDDMLRNIIRKTKLANGKTLEEVGKEVNAKYNDLTDEELQQIKL